jgi:hypothetical protein
MNISAFLDSADEIINNAENEIFNYVIDSYAEEDRAQKTDKKDAEVILIR